MARFPTLFVSHGSPLILTEDTPAAAFLKRLPESLPTPKAILCVSAHWMTVAPEVSMDPIPRTIHDFWGFPEPLYTIEYPAPGAPDIARQAMDLLLRADLPVAPAPKHGYDHGTWVPLKLAYPKADIPVVQISVQPRKDALWHFRLGQALAPLRDEGVLIIGSGAMTHNLEAYFTGGYETPPAWVDAFADWTHTALRERSFGALLDFERAAPYAAENHPTPEHFLPLFAALGAAGERPQAERLHASTDGAVLRMDAYAFH